MEKVLQLTGQLKEVTHDFMAQKSCVTFLVDQNINSADDLQGDLIIDVKKPKKKRSLDSNAYFHVLCDKLSKKVGISMAAMKNDLITSYGQIEYIDMAPVIIKTQVPPEQMREQEYIHLKPIRFEDGGWYYRMYRGSHTYQTDEMTWLIKGTVLEAQMQGIETLTENEIRHMNALWGSKNGNKAD